MILLIIFTIQFTNILVITSKNNTAIIILRITKPV
jgi:hypothetical protein